MNQTKIFYLLSLIAIFFIGHFYSQFNEMPVKPEIITINNDDEVKKQEAIILSMTKLERRKPKMINSSRKQRIAKGSGTVVSEVNRILKQHRKMADMMKKMASKILNCQFSFIQEAGHLSYIEDPDGFNSALENFLLTVRA